jgi:hypothetical protein
MPVMREFARIMAPQIEQLCAKDKKALAQTLLAS